MPKPKPKVLHPRPDVYQQALNAAKKRIEKALAEKGACEAQLARLNEEIPRLQRIIDVFELPPIHEPKIEDIRFAQDAPIIERPGIRPAQAALKQVPDHLKRFMQPAQTEPVPNGPDPDRFLPDVE